MSDYKSCDNCRHEMLDEVSEPCSKCINSVTPSCRDLSHYKLLWEPKKDAVNHPNHYNQGKYECIEVMAETFGKEAVQNFCLLNAFKYIWRAGEKNGEEDVRKAIWYLNKMLELNTKDDD